jgi:hypothetical protein
VASCSGNSTFGGPEANVLVDLLLDRMQNSTRCAFAVSNSTGYLLANSSCVPAMWHQLGMDLDGEAAEHSSGGGSVSLLADGKTVAIGARYNDANASDAGHVRVYDFNDTSWNQVGVDLDGEDAGDQSGYSVALSADGRSVAIGARFNGNGSDAGHVRVYTFD